jgi:hypothetical protein
VFSDVQFLSYTKALLIFWADVLSKNDIIYIVGLSENIKNALTHVLKQSLEGGKLIQASLFCFLFIFINEP